MRFPLCRRSPKYFFFIDFRATSEKLCETVTVAGAIQPACLGDRNGGDGGRAKILMCDRFVELVALGPGLREQAERRGKGVNEAYFLVHEVLTQAFADLPRIPSDALRDHVSSQLERKLGDCRADVRLPCRRTGVLRARRVFERLPAIWKLISEQSAHHRRNAGAVSGAC